MNWKIYREFYRISDCGEIESLRPRNSSGTWVRMKPSISVCNNGQPGYKRITVVENGKFIYRMVHQIVVEAFIGPIGVGKVINHKDGNKLNNNLSNLEVVTWSQNTQHAIKNGLLKPSENKFQSFDDCQILTMATLYGAGIGAGVAAKDLGMRKDHYHDIKRGKINCYSGMSYLFEREMSYKKVRDNSKLYERSANERRKENSRDGANRVGNFRLGHARPTNGLRSVIDAERIDL